MSASSNIVLIGMAGVGKSTVGVLLAKALNRNFVDTDLVVQSAEGKRLQEMVDTLGTDAFREIEELHVLSIRIPGAVIATGGSVVYSSEAMEHLKAHGTTIFLQLAIDTLEERLSDAGGRGLVIDDDQSFTDLYQERLPLYLGYSDFTIECDGMNHDEVVTAIVNQLG